MNKAQKIVVMVGLAAALLVVLFPPWRLAADVYFMSAGWKDAFVHEYLGCHWVFAPEDRRAELWGRRPNFPAVFVRVPTAQGFVDVNVPDVMRVRTAQGFVDVEGDRTLWTTPYVDWPRLSLRLLAVAVTTALVTILAGMLTKRRT